MRTLGIIFYTAVLVFIGIVLMTLAITLSVDKLQPQCINYIENMIFILQDSPYSRIVIGLSGFLLILISFSFAQLILARFTREKTIAFSTSSGEVTVSLSAIEDLIRRLSGVIPEIKELRPNVIATKKGTIVVDLPVIFKSEVNIPEVTSRLQEMTKSKIQEVLGLEEEVIIKIHILKIISADERDRKKKDTEKDEPTIPFGGYGRM
jgi:uncharacterized alkaline shock family protein YloU